MNKEITITVADPPADHPHNTRAEEIKELPTFLSAEMTTDDGTDFVVTDPTKTGVAGNTGRVFFNLGATGLIEGVYSITSGGVLNRWVPGADDFDETLLAATMRFVGGMITPYLDGVTLLTNAADAEGKTSIYVKPLTDGTTITAAADGTLSVPNTSEYFIGKVDDSETYSVPITWPSAMSVMTLARLSGTMDLSGDDILITQPGVYVASFTLQADSTVTPMQLSMWAKLSYAAPGATSYASFGANAAIADLDASSLGQLWTLTSTAILDVSGATESTPAHLRFELAGYNLRVAGVPITLSFAYTGNDRVYLARISLVRIGSLAS